MRRLLEETDRILIGGHRGCSCEYPENSIAAMEEGLKRGADYLEIDVQLTRDAVPVIYHDVRLEKKTALTGYVHEYDFACIREQISGLCTLGEVMEWGCRRDAYFALELKSVPLDMQSYNLRLVEQMIPVIKSCGMAGQVFLFGQDYQVLRHAKTLNQGIQTGLIVPFVPVDPVGLMKSMDALVYLSYIYNMTPSVIDNLKRNGYFVSGAILREPKWVERAVELGVHMFESDEPEVARQVAESR